MLGPPKQTVTGKNEYEDRVLYKDIDGRKGHCYYFLADQLNRAALSIAANIAEGNGRFTRPDRHKVFGIARGSVEECVPLFELAHRNKRAGPRTRPL